MDIKLLKTAIVQNNIPSFMIFNVDESTLCKQYIKTISSILNLMPQYYEKASDVVYNISTNLKDDYLYIVFNDIDAFNYIDEFLKYKDRHIIIYFDSCNFDIKNYNNYKDYVVNFNQLEKYTLLAYLMKILSKNKIEISQDRVEKLLEYCNNNMSFCCNELDKIITLEQTNSNMLFDYMLKNGFSDYRELNIFEFAKQLLNKDIALFDIIDKFDESLISLFTIIYKLAKAKLETTSNITYANLMQLCSLLDLSIKDGSINADYTLKYLLLKYM